MGIKRTLTTLQITQFLVGASNAMFHSFVSYVAPIILTKETIVPVAADTPTDPAESAGAFDNLKKLVFGSAVESMASSLDNAASASAPASVTQLETETVYVTQPCIATTGETFAIWLNVLYLAPLTYLFVSFFIASYVKRSNAASKVVGGKGSRRLSNVTLAEKAGWDAAKSIEKEVYGGEKMLDGSAVENGASAKAARSPRRRG